MGHRLSIVIPTRNRAVYCASTVRSVLAYPDALQLIVQDSSDGDELRDALSAISDPRLVYKKVSPDLNMTENFDSALRLASGTYVLMLGDDDGISPKIFDAVDLCERMQADSITSREFYAAYNWPDFRSKYSGDYQAGKLSLNSKYDSQVSTVDLPAEIDKFLGNAGQGCMSLPRIYHGLVSQELIQSIRTLHGACFFGVSPDVSFSFLAALHSRAHLVANFPITIAGASGKSNAGRSALRTHKGELWEDPHMKNYKNEKWPGEVPEFFSVESVWAQAALAAVSLEAPAYRKKFNFALLYALMLLRHPDQRSRIAHAESVYLRSSGDSPVGMKLRKLRAFIALGFATVLAAFKSVFSRFVKKTGSLQEATDIEGASRILKANLESSK